MNLSFFSKTISASFFLAFCINVLANSPNETSNNHDSFVRASALTETFEFAMNYPGGEAQMGRSGRVLMQTMVNKNGKPFEPMVMYSTNQKFNKAALKALKAGAFTPATLNGLKIESTREFIASFIVDAASFYGNISNKKYFEHKEKFDSEINSKKPDPKKLKKLLKKMRGTRHGDNRIGKIIAGLQYDFDAKFSSEIDQIQSLRELMLAYHPRAVQAGNSLAVIKLLELLINTGRYSEALDTYDEALRRYKQKYKKLVIQAFGPSIVQIRDIQSSDKTYATKIKIGDSGYTFIPLLKRSFAFDQIIGEITSLKLRCDKKFAQLPFSQTNDYQIPEKWGWCQLQIIGEKNAMGELLQQ